MIETSAGQKIYGFWDGDFTFHVGIRRGLRGETFRVRIDSDPEKRAAENMLNPNQMRAVDKVVPATGAETANWLGYFSLSYPERGLVQTGLLRHLRLQGPADIKKFNRPQVQDALRLLTEDRAVCRDFAWTECQFVQADGDIYSLTDDGLWLTGLMK